jgi:mRNA-degrading endonuclease RelE of RelBE toxin-antitoxin system
VKLVLTSRAETDLAALDRAARLRVTAAIQRLVLTNAGNIKKLQDIDPPEYRLRVGDWRVRFSRPDADTVCINRVQDLKDVYR